jgi:hypothetical protein
VLFVLDNEAHSNVGGRLISIAFGGGGGCYRKGKGEFSGLNDKPDTDGQPYLTISYTSGVSKIKFQTGCEE